MSIKQDIVDFLKSLISIIGDDTKAESYQGIVKYRWTKQDIELIHYGAKNEVSIDFMLAKLPKYVTRRALMAKARRLGYAIRGGKLCSKA